MFRPSGQELRTCYSDKCVICCKHKEINHNLNADKISYLSNRTTCFVLLSHHQIIITHKNTYMVYFNNLIKADIIKKGFGKEENYCCASATECNLFSPHD